MDLKGNNERLKQNTEHLGQEINEKLDNVVTGMQNLLKCLDEAETRINQVESWAEGTEEVNKSLFTCLEQHRWLQLKLTDFES